MKKFWQWFLGLTRGEVMREGMDAMLNKANQEGHAGRTGGSMAGAAVGAGVGSFAGPVGAIVGAGIGVTIGVLGGEAWDSSRRGGRK